MAYAIQSGVTDEAREALFRLIGLSTDGMAKGRIWQLLSYSLVHGSWLHVVVNVVMIGVFGRKLVWILGLGRTFVIGAGGVLVGGVFHLGAAWLSGNPAVLVGASGAVMALLFALLTLSPESRMWPLPVSARSLQGGLVLSMIMIAAIDPALGVPGVSLLGQMVIDAGGAVVFHASQLCHLGGGLVGYLGARSVLRRPVGLEDLRRQRRRAESVTAA